MKNSKRLLAVLMAVVMILTIVPLGLFAFAGDEEQPKEDPKPGSAENPIIIHNYSELQTVMNGLVDPTKEAPDPTYPSNGYYKLDAEGTFNSDAALVEWLKTNGASVAEELNITNRYHDVIYAKATSYEAGAKYYIDDKGQTELTEYVTPENFTEYYVDNGGGEPYSLATSYTPEYRHYKDAEGTVEVPVIKRDYATYYVKFADAYWEAAQITDLTDAQKADLIAENNLEFVYTTPTTIFRGQLDGNNVTFSGLKIKSVSVDGGNVYAGLVSSMAGGSVLKNLTMDKTCTVTVNGDGAIIAGSFVAVSNISGLQNVKSSATINVTNKLYAPKSAEDTSNKYSTVVGGLAGTGLGLVISKSTFDGSINFKYDEASFDGVNLKDVYEKASVNIGGIAGALGLSDKDCKADDATLTSTYLGVAVKAGKLNATNNDYTLLAEYTKDAQTYPDSEEGYKNADIFGAAQTVEPDENGYQLVKAADTASGITYAYIRTATCAHKGTPILTAEKPATCKEDGNIAYCQCPDCEKYFEGTTFGTEIALADTVISKDTIAHTLEPVAAVEAKCETAGNGEYWKCSVCDKCFSDAEGTTEAEESSFTIAALGHSWDSGEVTKEPSYTEEGVRTYHCTREGCTETKTESIPKLVPPTVTPKSSSGYKATKTGSLNTIILPNPSNKAGTTVASFKNNLESGYTYIVKDSKGNTVISGPIGTKFTVEISGYSNTKVTVIVRGDTDCNGSISSMDYVKIKNHIRGTSKITDAVIQVAADANNDSKLNATDYVRVKNVIRNSK